MTNHNEGKLPSSPRLNKSKQITNANQDIYYSNNMLGKTEKIYDQFCEHLKGQSELQEKFHKKLSLLIADENPFNELLSTLPLSYPISKILVSGTLLNTTEFINVDRENGLAYFLDGTHLITVQANKLTAIIW